MQTSEIKMKAAVLVLCSMLAYSYAQNCSTADPPCSTTRPCGWTCKDSSENVISNANLTVCSNPSANCSLTGTVGTCTAACTGGSGSSKLEFLTPLLVLGILARLCFYP